MRVTNTIAVSSAGEVSPQSSKLWKPLLLIESVIPGSVITMSKLLQEKISLLPSYAKGPAVVHLIRDCVEHPHIFNFGELLQLPNVQALAESPETEKWLRLLQLFAFGVYSDYASDQTGLPDLSPGMIAKLRSLTLISMAEKTKRIAYQTLLQELALTSRRELENLIIDVIYAKAVTGKMDQKNDRLEVDSSIGRDTKPDELDAVAAVLTAWCENCDNVLSCMEAQIAVANSLKLESVNKRQELDAQMAKTRAAIKAAGNEFEEEAVLTTPPGQRNENFMDRMKRGVRMRRPKPHLQSHHSDFFK